MNEFFNKIPIFWQGVLTSIVAGILILILTYFIRIFSKEFQNSSKIRKAQKNTLKIKVNSFNALERTEGSLLFIFQILKYLFIGNILWVMPEAIGSIVDIWMIYIVKFFSLISFAMGLRWIYLFYASTSIMKHFGSINQKTDSNLQSSSDFEIIEAIYGTVNNKIDIKEKLKKSIVNNRLAIVASNAIGGDPDPGFLKKLKIKYKYNGKEYETNYPERQFVDLP